MTVGRMTMMQVPDNPTMEHQMNHHSSCHYLVVCWVVVLQTLVLLLLLQLQLHSVHHTIDPHILYSLILVLPIVLHHHHLHLLLLLRLYHLVSYHLSRNPAPACHPVCHPVALCVDYVISPSYTHAVVMIAPDAEVNDHDAMM